MFLKIILVFALLTMPVIRSMTEGHSDQNEIEQMIDGKTEEISTQVKLLIIYQKFKYLFILYFIFMLYILYGKNLNTYLFYIFMLYTIYYNTFQLLGYLSEC